MASSDFSSAIAVWVVRTKKRMEGVASLSTRRLVETVIERTPDASGALVNSFQVSGSAMPVMQAGGSGEDAEAVNPATLSVPLGGMIYMGFTEPYAAEVEYGRNGRAGHGMVRRAAQEWRNIVEQAVRETD